MYCIGPIIVLIVMNYKRSKKITLPVKLRSSSALQMYSRVANIFVDNKTTDCFLALVLFCNLLSSEELVFLK